MTDVATALVFPGQGAEEPEMGLRLAATDARARRLLELASDATHVGLPRAIERGGRALARTEVLQPALVAVSLGAAHAMAARGVVFSVVLGHSLGELAAACFALDVDDETSIGLAAERGRRMQEAADAQPGGMIAVVSAQPIPAGLCVAAHNADDEHVLSGDSDAIARALTERRDATRLRVSGAWHSPAMSPVVEPFRASLERALAARTLRAPLLSAVSARVVAGDEIVDVLTTGLVSPVRWVDTLRALAPLHIARVALAPPARLSRSLVRRTLGTSMELAEP